MKTTALLLAPLLAAATPLTPRASTEESLDVLYKGIHKIYFGAATEYARLITGENMKIIHDRFGQVTPEYTMKWAATEPQRGVFTLGQQQQLVDWAVQNQKSIRGHTLLWYRDYPAYIDGINDYADMKAAIEEHVTRLVTQWKGKIRAWDVVNELFKIFEDDVYAVFRNSKFYQVMGEDFVKVAFKAAHAADPDAKLYINDYNLDDESWDKLKGLVAKVNQWVSEGVPIHGIGSQTHLQKGGAYKIESSLRALAAANVPEVAITELDITGASPQEYQQVVQACYYVPHCVGVTVWGIRDTDSDRAADTPLLFAESWAPKDAYYAIRDYLRDLQ